MTDTAKHAETPPGNLPTEFPTFATEEEEREFWDTHSSAPYWHLMEDVTDNPPPELRQRPEGVPSRAHKRPPTGRMDLVSLRLPAEMIDAVKAIAAERHLPYQTLLRTWIGERIDQERRSRAHRTGS
jgi:CopG antitoxin of type II toxin-antitoxin system